MRCLIDTNIFVDWLIDRNDNHANASTFIAACVSKKIDGYVTSHSLTDLFYVTRKNFSPEDRRKFILLIGSISSFDKSVKFVSPRLKWRGLFYDFRIDFSISEAQSASCTRNDIQNYDKIKNSTFDLIVSRFYILIEDKTIFLQTLTDINFSDLEDGLQIKCAENANLDYIVTENLRDFKNSKILAISTKDAINLFHEI